MKSFTRRARATGGFKKYKGGTTIRERKLAISAIRDNKGNKGGRENKGDKGDELIN